MIEFIKSLFTKQEKVSVRVNLSPPPSKYSCVCEEIQDTGGSGYCGKHRTSWA